MKLLKRKDPLGQERTVKRDQRGNEDLVFVEFGFVADPVSADLDFFKGVTGITVKCCSVFCQDNIAAFFSNRGTPSSFSIPRIAFVRAG